MLNDMKRDFSHSHVTQLSRKLMCAFHHFCQLFRLYLDGLTLKEIQ